MARVLALLRMTGWPDTTHAGKTLLPGPERYASHIPRLSRERCCGISRGEDRLSNTHVSRNSNHLSKISAMILIDVHSRIVPTCSTRWSIETARIHSLASSRCASATLSSSAAESRRCRCPGNWSDPGSPENPPRWPQTGQGTCDEQGISKIQAIFPGAVKNISLKTYFLSFFPTY